MRILVTDGDNRASLAITRALGRRGHQVIVGAAGHPCLASSSKYCHERILYPSPVNSPDAFLDALRHIVQEKRIDVLLPVADVTTIPVTAHAAELTPFCRIPFAGPEAIELAADKVSLIERARRLGVATPRSLVVKDCRQPLPPLTEFGFPIVVKPGRSRVRTEQGWLSTAVDYAHDEQHLRAILAQLPAVAYPVLLQERIIGPGVGVFACYRHGEPVAFFSHRRLREKPPSGGVSVLRESIPVLPAARESTEKLLGSLGWHGVAMVEYKLDHRDNLPKLMEINGRFWGSLQLAIDAGVDFPNLVVDLAAQRPVAPVYSYRTGVRSRWFLGDLDSLLLVLCKSRASLHLPADHQGRLSCLLNFLRLWEKNTTYEVLSFNDPRPWLYEVRTWLRRSVTLMAHAVSRSRH